MPETDTRLTNCHRAVLRRDWMGSGGIVNWIMLNPSTADEVLDDPTIRKCVGFSKRWGFSGLVVTNLFTFRATKPQELIELLRIDRDRALGAAADEIISSEARAAKMVVAAWGNHGTIAGRAHEVMSWLLRDVTLHCIGTTMAGNPLHPVMAGYTNLPLVYEKQIHQYD